MKQLFLTCLSSIIILAFTACNSSKNEAEKQAEAIKEAVKSNTPGGVATSENGAYIKAKIDGKNWSASQITPDFSPSSSYQVIAGDNGGDAMSFQLWKRGIEIDKKLPFSENHAVNLTLEDFSGFLSGKTGEAVVTKMNDQWMEGTFFYTATSSSSDKKIEVTDGSFRIPLVAGAK